MTAYGTAGPITTEGPTPAFRPLPARSTLLRRQRLSGLVQTRCLVCRSTPRLVGPCGLSSDSMPRCLETASATDVHVTSTRTITISGDLPPSAVGNPPAFDFWTAVATRLVQPMISTSGAGPPCGHPASGGCTLDGAPPALGRSTPRSRGSRGGESTAACSAGGSSVDSIPLTPLVGGRDRGR